MKTRCVAGLFTLAVVLAFGVPVLAQSEDPTMPMRRPHGDPDISGIFTFRTLTPLQRPRQFAEQETLDAETAAAFEASERTRQNRDLFDPVQGAPNAGYAPRAQGGVLSYNEFWYERGVDLTDEKRTSLIIDPPDGRFPPRTPEAQAAARERAAYRREHMYDSYENRSLMDRCIMGFNAGPPMSSSAYNNNVMIFQTEDHVVILNEMVHNARIIPIDDVAKPPFKQFSGVSRGHWEGETFVVETTQFRGGESRGTSPEQASHRAVHADQSEPGGLRVHGHRPHGLHRAAHGVDAVPPHRRPALRVRVPRRQHRPARDSRRRARARAAGPRAAAVGSDGRSPRFLRTAPRRLLYDRTGWMDGPASRATALPARRPGNPRCNPALHRDRRGRQRAVERPSGGA